MRLSRTQFDSNPSSGVCVCTGDEDSTFIMWMSLKKGAAQRCGCGHWFQLVQANPTKLKQEQMQRSNLHVLVDIIITKCPCMYCGMSVLPHSIVSVTFVDLRSTC